ncbi:MAG TPA: hypothetical protein DEP00_00195 [Lachnospiraceae bacterium]|nr:hypothetical protein [Lachnospiraceae bacterium]
MRKIRISTESTADIPGEMARELGIEVLPLTININGTEYHDGVDITPQQVYRHISEDKEMPKTSQVTSAVYMDLYERMYEEGVEELIHVAINSKGSGCYQSACLARTLFYEENEEAMETFRIHVIDSGTYSMLYGIPVIEAARMVRSNEEGRTDYKAHQISDYIRDWTQNAFAIFVPLDLKVVKKSGRISAAKAVLGEVMGIKPIISMENGETQIIAKVRGEIKVINKAAEIMKQNWKVGSEYALAYGTNMEAYGRLTEAVAKVTSQPPICQYPVGCAIACNTGANMVAILMRTEGRGMEAEEEDEDGQQ